jgi:hypothetical protein
MRPHIVADRARRKAAWLVAGITAGSGLRRKMAEPIALAKQRGVAVEGGIDR